MAARHLMFGDGLQGPGPVDHTLLTIPFGGMVNSRREPLLTIALSGRVDAQLTIALSGAFFVVVGRFWRVKGPVQIRIGW